MYTGHRSRPVAVLSSVAIDPAGTYLYVANQFGSSSTISGYAIDATSGVLTPIKGSPFPGGFNSNAIAIDPTGRFVYVTKFWHRKRRLCLRIHHRPS